MYSGDPKVVKKSGTETASIFQGTVKDTRKENFFNKNEKK